MPSLTSGLTHSLQTYIPTDILLACCFDKTSPDRDNGVRCHCTIACHFQKLSLRRKLTYTTSGSSLLQQYQRQKRLILVHTVVKRKGSACQVLNLHKALAARTSHGLSLGKRHEHTYTHHPKNEAKIESCHYHGRAVVSHRMPAAAVPSPVITFGHQIVRKGHNSNLSRCHHAVKLHHRHRTIIIRDVRVAPHVLIVLQRRVVAVPKHLRHPMTHLVLLLQHAGVSPRGGQILEWQAE